MGSEEAPNWGACQTARLFKRLSTGFGAGAEVDTQPGRW